MIAYETCSKSKIVALEQPPNIALSWKWRY